MRVYRPTCVEVDLTCIRNNTSRLVRLGQTKGVGLIAVVKADAYGHGALQASRAALQGGASMLAVATVEEGLSLRQGGIDAPILVMGAYVSETCDAYVDNDLIATITDDHQVQLLTEALSGTADQVRVHVKVDTGMGRLGVLPSDAMQLVKKVAQNPALVVEGVYSHLAMADDPDPTVTEMQIQQFDEILAALHEAELLPKYRHILNSSGLLQHRSGQTNMARVGLALFGLYPTADRQDDHRSDGPVGGEHQGRDHALEASDEKIIELQPALSWKTHVATAKRVPAGMGVGYGHTFHTRSDTTLITIPVGYADGFKRGLSSRADVLVGGRRFPVSGRISMDQTIVDVGHTPVSVGDEVVLIGRQGNEQIFVEEWAEMLGTINYEIVATISQRVARTYIGDNERLTTSNA